jgi:hypothetical protein
MGGSLKAAGLGDGFANSEATVHATPDNYIHHPIGNGALVLFPINDCHF